MKVKSQSIVLLALAILFAMPVSTISASAEPVKNTFTVKRPNMKTDMPLLKGNIELGGRPSPFLSGSVQTIPAETKINLVLPENTYINSQVSQKGDEIWLKVGQDVGNGSSLGVPGGWYMRGLITQVEKIKKGHRDGYVEIEFDKIVSPNGDYEVDFPAKFSSKDKVLKMVAKQVAIGSAYTGAGAAAGALLAWQLTGIQTTIATYGINIGVGAGVGAAIGIFGFGKSTGKIDNFTPGEMITLTTNEPITTVAFNPNEAQSAKPTPTLQGLDLKIEKFKFVKTPWDDKSSKLLEVYVDVDNRSKETYHFFDVAAISENGQSCPQVGTGAKGRIMPNQKGKVHFLFFSNGTKQKYFLLFKSRRTGSELSRVPIN